MRQVPSWDEYFLNIASTVSSRSKDPSRQVGCLIVNDQKIIIGTGYNGMPPGTLETPELWERPTKYKHVIHAEINALTHTININNYKDLTIYTTTFPCLNCMKEIIKTPIKTICYKEIYTDSAESMALAYENNIMIQKI